MEKSKIVLKVFRHMSALIHKLPDSPERAELVDIMDEFPDKVHEIIKQYEDTGKVQGTNGVPPGDHHQPSLPRRQDKSRLRDGHDPRRRP